MLASPVAAQCVARVSLPPHGSTAGETLCASIVPIGVVRLSGFESGCSHRYVIKPGEGTSGNWGYLDFGPCPEGLCGAARSNQLECQLANGAACSIGPWVSTLPGAHRGALRDAMQARFDSDTDRRPDLCFDQYLGNGRRVVVLPLTTALENGRSPVGVTGFAVFFLTALPSDGGDAVEAEYLHDLAP
jgi:hypothetical protein